MNFKILENQYKYSGFLVWEFFGKMTIGDIGLSTRY